MGFSSTIDKIESVVNLPFALKIAGAAILLLTVWKGVHGFFPTAGLIVGAAMLFVGGEFNKLYR
jgi:hypothetical protein